MSSTKSTKSTKSTQQPELGFPPGVAEYSNGVIDVRHALAVSKGDTGTTFHVYFDVDSASRPAVFQSAVEQRDIDYKIVKDSWKVWLNTEDANNDYDYEEDEKSPPSSFERERTRSKGKNKHH